MIGGKATSDDPFICTNAAVYNCLVFIHISSPHYQLSPTLNSLNINLLFDIRTRPFTGPIIKRKMQSGYVRLA